MVMITRNPKNAKAQEFVQKIYPPVTAVVVTVITVALAFIINPIGGILYFLICGASSFSVGLGVCMFIQRYLPREWYDRFARKLMSFFNGQSVVEESASDGPTANPEKPSFTGCK